MTSVSCLSGTARLMRENRSPGKLHVSMFFSENCCMGPMGPYRIIIDHDCDCTVSNLFSVIEQLSVRAFFSQGIFQSGHLLICADHDRSGFLSAGHHMDWLKPVRLIYNKPVSITGQQRPARPGRRRVDTIKGSMHEYYSVSGSTRRK